MKALQMIGVSVLMSLFLSACQTKTHVIPDIETQLPPAAPGDYVVLLHGMWRSGYAMEPIAQYLQAKGYRTINVSYPSTEFPIETLVDDYLAPAVESIPLNQGQKIHFVSHSMGGILVRYYLKHHNVPNPGRVVMLSPPNQGTDLVDLVKDTGWYEGSIGPAGMQLSTGSESWIHQLGPVDFELGVIAGNYNPNWLTSWILPGDDDGVVPVDKMKVDGMSDLLLVSERHYQLRRHKPVLQQIVYFLETGEFLHASSVMASHQSASL